MPGICFYCGSVWIVQASLEGPALSLGLPVVRVAALVHAYHCCCCYCCGGLFGFGSVVSRSMYSSCGGSTRRQRGVRFLHVFIVCVLGNYCVRVHVPWKIQPPNSPCSCVCFSAKNCCTNLNPHHRNFCYVSHVLCCCQCYRHETTQYDFLVPRTSPCGDHTSSDYFTTIFPTGIYTPFMCHWYTHRTTATTELHYFQGWCCPLSLWFTPCERHPRFGGIKNNLTLRTDQIDHDLDNIDNLDPQPAVMTCCAGSVYEQ